MNALIVFFSSLLGGFVQTVSGFGCGIVIMLFLPYFMPLLQASGLSVLVCIILNVLLVIKYRKYTNLKLVIAPAAISFLVSTICIYYSTRINLSAMKIVFSLFLIALAVYFIFFSERIKLRPNLKTVVICATLAGAANGLFGIGGPPMALYFLTVTGKKEEYIGTTQTYFLLTSVYSTVVRIMGGILDGKLLLTALPGILAVLLGGRIGALVVDKISHEKMKQVIYIALAAAGGITLLQCL